MYMHLKIHMFTRKTDEHETFARSTSREASKSHYGAKDIKSRKILKRTRAEKEGEGRK